MWRGLSVLTLLVLLLLPGAAHAATPDFRGGRDCSIYPGCKTWVQWDGVASGGWDNLEITDVACSNVCTEIDEGLWTKNAGSQNYIFDGIYTFAIGTYGYAEDYGYAVYQGGGYTMYDLVLVPTADFHVQPGTTFDTYRSSNTNAMQVVIESHNYIYNNPSNDTVDTYWDILENGLKAQSYDYNNPNYAVAPNYRTWNSRWRNATTQIWTYQQSVGNPYNQNTAVLASSWAIAPTCCDKGGTWQANYIPVP